MTDPPGQYLAMRYTERLAEEGAVTSVGSRGDRYDNALAETVNGLYKTELVRPRGPWRTVDALEVATAAWVQWWNEELVNAAGGTSLGLPRSWGSTIRGVHPPEEIIAILLERYLP